MATVRITGNTPNNIHKMEWLGTPAIDKAGRIERSIDLPEEIYQAIERSIAGGNIEGFVFTPEGRKVEWFLDRGPSGGGGTAVVIGH